MLKLNSSWHSRFRRVIDLNVGWDFIRSRADATWLQGQGAAEPVDLPHDWNATDEFLPGVEYYRGEAAYRRRLALPPPAPGSRRILSLGGFYGWGELWIDGAHAGPVLGDYLGVDVDVTSALAEGGHTLALRLTNAWRPNVLPGLAMPDFLLYGGLAGGCRLIDLPATHLDDAATWTCAHALGSADAELEIATAIAGEITPAGTNVSYSWHAPDGTPLHRGDLKRSDDRYTARIPLARDAARWSCDAPRLHRLRLSLQRGSDDLDELEIPVGLRTTEFRPRDRFYLNGERLELRGANRHESLAGFGHALPTGIHRHDAQQLKAMGLNLVRLAHYPQSPEFLQACDEAGVLIYAELASWKSVRGGRWLKAARSQLRQMIQRDRHHPSVILWGLGNESRHTGAYHTLDADAKKHDPEQRPTIYAENHLYRAKRQGVTGLTDVWGINYETEVAEAALPRARQQCALVSEAANLPHARRGHGCAEWEQVQLVAKALRAAARPGIAGVALWSYADYSTLRKSRYRRYCGLLDAWRSPKATAAWLTAIGTDAPVLHVDVDWGRQGQPIRQLRIITNATRVRRDTDQEWHPVKDAMALWSVRHDDRPLHIVSQHGPDARESTVTLQPWGRAAALSAKTVLRIGSDPRVAWLEIQVVDEQARPVLVWNGRVDVQPEPGVRTACLAGEWLPIHAGRARCILWRMPDAPPTARIRLTVEELPALEVDVAWPDDDDEPSLDALLPETAAPAPRRLVRPLTGERPGEQEMPHPTPRVAQLHSNTEWGGGEFQLLELARGLDARGVFNVVLTPPDGPLYREAERAGCRVEPLPIARGDGRRKAIAAACDLLRELSIDLLHAHDSPSTTLGIRLSHHSGIPLVLSRRIASPIRRNPRSRSKYSARRLAAVLAISETVRDVFLQTGYPAERVFVVPSGLDVTALDAMPRDPDFRARFGDGPLVGGLGKLSTKKNWSMLVQTAAELKRRGRRIQWVLIGDGPQRDALSLLIDELQVADCVHLLGFQPNASRLTRNLDVLFFPSLMEGASVTVREAMALGVPVVAVNATGTMESLAGHGWGVAPDDLAAAADAVEQALFNPDLRATRIEGARAFARSHYRFEHTVDATLNAYVAALAADA